MQLSVLTNGLRRRWKLVLGLFVLSFLSVVLTYRPTPWLYRTEVRFIVGTQPLDSTLDREEEKYYNWVASEYVVAGISDYVNGGDFKALVGRQLEAEGYEDLGEDEVGEFVSAGYVRSRLVLAVTHPDETLVEPIAFAAADALMSVDDFALGSVDAAAPVDVQIPQLERSPAFVYPIDSSLVIEEIDLRDDIVRTILRRALSSLIFAAVVATLVEFYDPTIRSRDTAESLALPILAEIPVEPA